MNTTCKVYVVALHPQQIQLALKNMKTFFHSKHADVKISLTEDLFLFDSHRNCRATSKIYNEHLVWVANILIKTSFSEFKEMRNFFQELSEQTATRVQVYVEEKSGKHQEKYLVDCSASEWPYELPQRYDPSFTEDDCYSFGEKYDNSTVPLFTSGNPSTWEFDSERICDYYFDAKRLWSEICFYNEFPLAQTITESFS